MNLKEKLLIPGKKHGGTIGKELMGDKLLYSFGITFFSLLGAWVKDTSLFPFEYVVSIGYIFAIISVASAIKNVGFKTVESKAEMESEDRKVRREMDKFESYHRMKILGSKAKIQTYAVTSILGDIDENTPQNGIKTLIRISNGAMERVDKLVDEIVLPYKNWVLERYTPEVEKEIRASDLPIPTEEGNKELSRLKEDIAK